MNWTGTVEIKRIFVDSGEVTITKKGVVKPKLIPISLRSIVLTNGTETLKFGVNRRGHIIDDRETKYGFAGTTGLWGTLPECKAGGPKKSLTPQAWAKEMNQLLTGETVDSILSQLC